MKVCGSDGMLQVTERGFLPPPEMVNVLDLFQGKLTCVEVGNDVLINPFRNLETDYSQPHAVFGAAARDKVKGDCFAYIAV